ncbi:GerMN domain-containing protein [Bacillus sp. 1P06AnD]|uniref:GerMN domain-containing protein n=1 Tax=Bacillus sp. 1P06AnD TaxID=3132208 RepID=UPI0039A1E594
MSKKTSAAIATTVLASSVILGGCGLFNTKEKAIDPPQREVMVNDSASLNEKADTKEKTAKNDAAEGKVVTELYLIDKNGYVVPRTMALPNTQGVTKQALEYLVKDGPVSNLLPSGFRAVLPADTQVDVDVAKDGKTTVDFSKEFANYEKKDELRILEAITWTITQFDNVKNVTLKMNGHELKEMPVNHTPISKHLSRASGINIDTSDIADLTNTKPLTVYYLGGKADNYYYVPVTKRISSSEKDMATAVVNQLAEVPSGKSNLVTEFMPELALLDPPKVKDGELTLNFSESIYGSFEENTVSQRLIDALVLSLTEQKNIKKVDILVKGKPSLKTEDGKELNEPVMRPQKVNSTSL